MPKSNTREQHPTSRYRDTEARLTQFDILLGVGIQMLAVSLRRV